MNIKERFTDLIKKTIDFDGDYNGLIENENCVIEYVENSNLFGKLFTNFETFYQDINFFNFFTKNEI